ncbi:Fusaric acid resistance protein-like [Nakamurella panacisegetis]|uniref:Fusaric acid resistance protein-like n=2 Tax=Nakamurella panacisegetis TaxID=1090615 RepID=A0A1H0HMA3_9ACTN|nr:Fusaric acid resistance protein-like [Nakamurella panacisegetis]
MFNTPMLTTFARRLRAGWLPLLEATAGATLAWFVAATLIGHHQPFFAPAATIIVLSQARGARITRALEVFLAVAGGVLLADIVAQLLEPWPTLTIAVLIVVTLTITTALDAGPVVVVQATVSALYVAVVSPPTQTLVPNRFLDALVGGGIALLISQVGAARDPFGPAVDQIRGICDRIVAVIRTSADAVEQHDRLLASEALAQARASDAAVTGLQDAATGAREALQLDPVRRQQRAGVTALLAAIRQLDYVVRGARILARASVTVTNWPATEASTTADIPVALRHLERAVGHLGLALIAELRRDEPGSTSARAALDAEAMATIDAARSILAVRQPLPIVMIVGQLRSITIDLLRGAGNDDTEVLNRVDQALGFPTL